MEVTQEMIDAVLGTDAVKQTLAEQAKTIADQQLSGLQNKNAELLGEVKKLKEFKRGVPDDLDLEEYTRLKEAAKKAEQDEAEKKGEWEKLRQTMADTHAKEKAELEEQRDTFKTAMESNMLNSVVAAALAKAGGSPVLMTHVVKGNLRVEQDAEGNYGVVVIDPATKTPRINGSEGKPMTIDALVEEFASKPEYAPAFDGTKASGSGAGKTGRPGRQTKKIADMSRKEKSDLISDIGLDEYNKRRRAGK